MRSYQKSEIMAMSDSELVRIADQELDIPGCRMMGASELRSRVIIDLEAAGRICPADIIDLDAAPFVPRGWTVREHKKGGQWEFKPEEVELYLSEPQLDGDYPTGVELLRELKDKPVLNANALDYLLDHHHLIPEEWKGREVFFWGTLYCNGGGEPYVLCLHWTPFVGWIHRYRWTGNAWLNRDPAAILKA